jgi:O-methyltransferase
MSNIAALRRIVYAPVFQPVLSLVGKAFFPVFSQLLLASNNCAVSFNNDERIAMLKLIRTVYRERTMLLTPNEAYQLLAAVQAARKIEGEFAEIGVFQGASSKLICEFKGERALHLFDTFEGLPEPGNFDSPERVTAGQYAHRMEDVRTYLGKYSNVHLYRGLFPDSAGPVADKRFAFVNIDVDLYEGTYATLEFIYPRMNRGALLMSHDYASLIGVRRAFDEFFRNRVETVMQLTGSQCLVVKN